MAYATLSDVQARLAQFTLSSTSKPNTTQVQAFINQIAGAIDAALSSADVEVPVTEPSSFVDWLTGLNADGAAAIALNVMFPEGAGPAQVNSGSIYQTLYMNGLKAIQSGGAIPAGVLPGAGYTSLSTYFTRNPEEEEELGDLEGDFAFPMSKVF